jgi:cyanophycin synthetase
MAAASRRGWKVSLVNESLGLVRYTDTKGRVHYSQSVLTAATNAWQILVAKNKDLLYALAPDWGVAIPVTSYYENPGQAKDFLKSHTQIVVKPKDGAHGRGVTTHITTEEKLESAIELAQTLSGRVLLQEHVTGDDYRLLFIDGDCRASAIRQPATVTGDGEHTIKQLVELENQRPERGENYQTRMNRIDLEAAGRFLDQKLTDVPSEGEKVQVVGPANIGIGGSAQDVTDATPPAVLALANTVVQKLGLALAGIDIIYNPRNGPVLIEINANPSFGLHMLPQAGSPQPVADDFLDWLERSADRD